MYTTNKIYLQSVVENFRFYVVLSERKGMLNEKPCVHCWAPATHHFINHAVPNNICIECLGKLHNIWAGLVHLEIPLTLPSLITMQTCAQFTSRSTYTPHFSHPSRSL